MRELFILVAHLLAALAKLVQPEIKTVPYVPLSHPFVERLIGTVKARVSGPRIFVERLGLGAQTERVQGLLQQATELALSQPADG